MAASVIRCRLFGFSLVGDCGLLFGRIGACSLSFPYHFTMRLDDPSAHSSPLVRGVRTCKKKDRFISLSFDHSPSVSRSFAQPAPNSQAQRRWPVLYEGFSTIFQYESFLMTFPSRNSQWSHPRTRTETPSGVVPVSSHSDTPILPLTQCRSSL